MFVTFFLSLAVMDYAVMMKAWNPDFLYEYWMALGIVVVAFAASTAYTCWAAGMKPRYAYASFLTVVLLFVGGFLDLFFFLLTASRGEPYDFAPWSLQYKVFVLNGILPEWGWTGQIIWMSGCLAVIVLIWRYVLKK